MRGERRTTLGGQTSVEAAGPDIDGRDVHALGREIAFALEGRGVKGPKIG